MEQGNQQHESKTTRELETVIDFICRYNMIESYYNFKERLEAIGGKCAEKPTIIYRAQVAVLKHIVRDSTENAHFQEAFGMIDEMIRSSPPHVQVDALNWKAQMWIQMVLLPLREYYSSNEGHNISLDDTRGKVLSCLEESIIESTGLKESACTYQRKKEILFRKEVTEALIEEETCIKKLLKNYGLASYRRNTTRFLNALEDRMLGPPILEEICPSLSSCPRQHEKLNLGAKAIREAFRGSQDEWTDLNRTMHIEFNSIGNQQPWAQSLSNQATEQNHIEIAESEEQEMDQEILVQHEEEEEEEEEEEKEEEPTVEADARKVIRSTSEKRKLDAPHPSATRLQFESQTNAEEAALPTLPRQQTRVPPVLSPPRRQAVTMPRRGQKNLKRKRWTEEETASLRKGVEEHGTSWKVIKAEYSEILYDRTTVDLKDKWRNIQKSKK